MSESRKVLGIKPLVRERRQEPLDVAGVLKSFGQALRRETAVVVTAERNLPAVAGKFTEVHHVVDAVTDGGSPVGCKKCAEQVQADDAVTPENLPRVVVTEMALVVAAHD